MTEHQLAKPVVVVGVGEVGGVFARGALSAGRPVFPVVRSTDPAVVAAAVPEPAFTLIAVGEDDLHPTLATLPEPWHDSVVLVQNELLPRDWDAHGLTEPTVISVWFEKKPGKDVTVIIPSPIAGPCSDAVVEALEGVGVPSHRVGSGPELIFELVRKNLYILVANIAGLRTRSTVGELWAGHRELATAVAAEVLAIQRYLTGAELDESQLVAGMVEAFAADPEHGTTGRSAPRRLLRALGHAAEAGLDVPTIRELAHEAGVTP